MALPENNKLLMDESQTIQLLGRHGVKPTANRIVIAKALAAAHSPLSLKELEETILTIDKSGIYRTLMLFREHHLVHVLEDGDGGTKYELCFSHGGEVDDDEQVHFFCEHCHKTFCLSDTPVPAVPLPPGYVPRHATLMVKGLCPECARRERRGNGSV